MTSEQFTDYIDSMDIHDVQKKNLKLKFILLRKSLIDENEIHIATTLLIKLQAFTKYMSRTGLVDYLQKELEKYRTLMILRAPKKIEKISEL